MPQQNWSILVLRPPRRDFLRQALQHLQPGRVRLVFNRDQRAAQFDENQPAAHVFGISVTIVRTAPASSNHLATLPDISGVTRAIIFPPRPAPESLAPSAPDEWAASMSLSSSGEETPILRSSAWFSSINGQ